MAASDARRARPLARVSTGAPLMGNGDRDRGRRGARGVRVRDARAAEDSRGGLSRQPGVAQNPGNPRLRLRWAVRVQGRARRALRARRRRVEGQFMRALDRREQAVCDRATAVADSGRWGLRLPDIRWEEREPAERVDGRRAMAEQGGGVDRRWFLKVAGATTGAAIAGGIPAIVAAQKAP